MAAEIQQTAHGVDTSDMTETFLYGMTGLRAR
jgi:hypothetical protein